jgi:hypothetical protein
VATITEQTGTAPEQQLQPYLRSGERLLWSGRPDPAVRFTAKDAFLIPFSLMWGGFALFWEGAVIFGTHGTNRLFILWGIPFVAIGLYMMFGRFILKARRKRATAYGITDQRAMVAIGDRSLVDAPVKHTATSIKRTRDGRHVSVTFGAQNGVSRVYANTGMDVLAFWSGDDAAFYDVAEPERLLAALDRARSG